MSRNSPFIKKFSTSQHHYIYDVNTNEFVLVDRVVYDIIEDIGIISNTEIVEKYSATHPAASIKKGIKEINHARQNDGLFSNHLPLKMALGLSEFELKEVVDNDLKQVILNVTEQCNLRCHYCVFGDAYYAERKHSSKRMTIKTAKKGVEYLMAHSQADGDVFLSFYGGEPLLNFKVIQFAVRYVLARCGNRKVHLNLSTNGTLLSENIIRFLIDYDFSLAVSLDGPQEIHDRFRVDSHGNGTWETVIKNLRRIKSLAPDYYRRAVLFNVVLAPPFDIGKVNEFFSENADLWGDTIPKISAIDSTETNFMDICGVKENYYYQTNQKLMAQYEGQLHSARPSPFLRGYFQDDLINVHKRYLYKSLPETVPLNGCCIPGQRKIFVTCEGKLHICERISSYMEIGDLDRGVDFRRLYNIVNQYIEAFSEACCNCWAVRFCKTCFSTAKSAGDINMRLKWDICEATRERLLETISQYNSIMEKNPKAFDAFKNIVVR